MGSRDGPKARVGVSWLGVAISLSSLVYPHVNCTPQGCVGQEVTAGPACQDSCLVLWGMSR